MKREKENPRDDKILSIRVSDIDLISSTTKCQVVLQPNSNRQPSNVFRINTETNIVYISKVDCWFEIDSLVGKRIEFSSYHRMLTSFEKEKKKISAEPLLAAAAAAAGADDVVGLWICGTEFAYFGSEYSIISILTGFKKSPSQLIQRVSSDGRLIIFTSFEEAKVWQQYSRCHRQFPRCQVGPSKAVESICSTVRTPVLHLEIELRLNVNRICLIA